ncbi:MAG: N-acetyltransferase [Pseudomonadota bacterium]
MTQSGHGFTIRPAKLSDVPAIAETDVACWREAYRDILPPPMLARLSVRRRAAQWSHVIARSEKRGVDELFIAGDRADVVLGLGSCGQQRSRTLHGAGFQGEIYALYVSSAVQRRGIGTALMQAMGRSLERRGLNGLCLWVLAENRPAQLFYETLGAERLGGRKELWQGLLVLPEFGYGWRDTTAFLIGSGQQRPS